MKVFVNEIRSIIESARANAVRSVDFCRVQMYWQIGRRIVEEEQGGQARAEYGKGLIKNLATEIEPEYGSGFGYRQLNFARQFYLTYPKVNALRSQFMSNKLSGEAVGGGLAATALSFSYRNRESHRNE